jgi:hypothetical protein
VADENPPIRGKAAEQFADAAARVSRSAAKIEGAAGKTEQVARNAEDAASQLNRTARRLERKLSVQQTDGGKFYVEEDAGKRAGAQRYSQPMREGRSRPSYFNSAEAAKAEKSVIASERAARQIAANAENEASAVEKSEKRKTRAKAEGARARAQYDRPIGPELPTGRATGSRAVSDRRNALAATRADAIAEAQRLQRIATQAEGRVKAAYTRVRNLEAHPTGGRGLEGGAEAHQARIEKARAAIPRAEATAAEARAAHKTATEAAAGASDAERQLRKDIEATNRGYALRQSRETSPAAAEEAQTKATETGAKRRTKARADETKAAKGNAAEFEKITQARAEEARRELAAHEAYQARVKAGTAPAVGSAEFKRQAAQEAKQAQAIDEKRVGTPVAAEKPAPKTPAVRTPPTAEEEAAAADRRVAREQARRDADKAARARAAETKATEAAAKAKEEDARLAREAARRPGTDLIRHPTEFGQRVPGPFGSSGNVVGEGSGVVSRQYTIARNRAGRAERTAARADAAEASKLAAAESKRAAAMAASVDDAARMRQAAQGAGAAEGELSQQLTRSAITADLAGNRFRKNGALTTEFIEAARKGQVTMRELGYQVGATIGKFAGWTAAASAVYGVAAAMGQLAKGASDSVGGVQRVSRVVTDINEPGNRDRAQEGFRELSQRFNVPISQAVDATYGSGKIFGTLEASLQGATSALFAMKVGELDAASATESLNAIVKGFRLEAKELPGVFDAINSVTNKFGGNVGKLTQGVGRAGGLFASAGGTPEELIALLSAGSQETGVPATEVATAISRSVSTVRTKAGAARARAAGLDPTLDPYALIQQAQQLAKGQSPERVQEIVRSIIPAGGQFSRILTPLILDAERLNKTLAQTTPENRKASAQRELAKVMKEPVEQIAMLGNGLQRLGSTAGQAGFLTPFVLILKTLNTSISLVEHLFGLFHRVVPNFMEPILATALQVYGVLRLMRRFDIGGQIAGGGRSEAFRNYIGASPARRERTQITQGLDAEKRFLTGAREQAGTAAASAAFKQQQAAKRFAAAEAAGADPDELVRHQQNYLRASQRASDLIEEEADLRTQIDAHDARRVTFLRGIKQGLEPSEAARRAEIDYRTASVDRPTTQGPVPIQGPVTQAQHRAGVGLGAADESAKVAQATARQEARASSRLGRLATSFGALTGGTGSMRAATGAVGRSAQGVARGASAAASGLLSAGRSLAGAGRGLLAMVGPLDLALIGLFVGIAAIDAIKDKIEERRAEREKATEIQSDPQKIRDAVAKYKPPAGGGAGIRGGLPAGAQAGGKDADAYRAGVAEARQLEYQRSKGQSIDATVTQKELEDDLKTAPNRKAKRALIRSAISKLRQSFQVRYEGGDAGKAATAAADALVAQLAELGASGKDISAALAKMDAAALSVFTDQQAAAAELHGPRGRRKALSSLGLTTIAAANLYAENRDPVAYLKTLQEGEEAVTKLAEERLKRSLDTARSPAARARARRSFSRELASGLGIHDNQQQIDTLDVNNQRADINLKKLRARRDQLTATAKKDPLTGNLIGGLPSADSAELDDVNAKIRSLTERKRTNRRQAAALRDAQRRRKQILADEKRQQTEDARDEQEALIDARTALNVGRQDAGAPRIAYQIRRAGAVVRARIKRYGRNSVQALNAIQQQEDLQAQATQEAGGLITARAEYAAAGASTDQGADALRTSGLQAFAQYQKAHPKVYSESDVLGTLTQIREAHKQRSEQEHQDAVDLIGARYEYLKSLTDNPVELAKLEQQEAQRVLDKGGFKNQAEKYRAMANVNNAKREKEKAVNDRRIENLDYEHDIGRLTDDAYIRSLERIMRNMKVGSEQRRNLRMQIGRLKHEAEQEGEFNVNVGDIKLPTIYEIRRAVAGSKSAATVVQNNNVTLNAHGVNDPRALLAQVDNHLGRANKSAARAAGVR